MHFCGQNRSDQHSGNTKSDISLHFMFFFSLRLQNRMVYISIGCRRRTDGDPILHVSYVHVRFNTHLSLFL